MSWRAFIDTQAHAAELGDAIARGRLVWWSSGETGGDGRWVEPSRVAVAVPARETDVTPATARRRGRAGQ